MANANDDDTKLGTLASEADDAYQDVETQTYGEITWEQFTRYRLAYASMWAVALLFLLGIYAPVVASDLPFTLTYDGETQYPWIANLFNKTYYENTVDIVFNAFMFTLPLGFVVFLPAKIVAKKAELNRAATRAIKTQGVVAGFALTVAVAVWLVADPLSGSTTLSAILWSAAVFGFLAWALGAYVGRLVGAMRRAAVTSRPAMIGLAVGVVLGAAIGGSLGGGDSDQRPDSAMAQALGWYEYQFPLNDPAVAKLTEFRDVAIGEISGDSDGADVTRGAVLDEVEGAGFEVTYPPVIFSFRATSTLIDAEASWAHPLGTDNIGRDNFARMVFGTRIALTIGVVAVGIYITIGVILGALAGYFGGWVDMLIVRFIEIMLCFPSLFLILTLASFVDEPSVFYVVLIIGITRWTGPARLVRGEFLRLRNQEFVQAAKALGLPEWRIIFRHILPNALGPVLVAATFGVASTILVESTISFLGMGDPSAPTWGKILNDGRVFRNTTMILLPGFAIFLTVSLFNLIGEGLRDALDPKMRR